MCDHRTFLRRSSVSLCLFVLFLTMSSSTVLAQQGARVTGKVTDDSGTGLPNIELRLVAQDPDGATVDSIETDKTGRFTEPSLRGGTYQLELVTPGYRVAFFAVEVRAAGGAQAADFKQEVPPGIKPTPFQVRQGFRLDLKIELAATEQEQAAQRSLAAALEESAKLRELNALYEQGRMEQLAAEAAALVERDPDLGGAWYLLGVARWQGGDHEPAVSAFRRALALSPEQPGVRGALGSALLDLGDQRLGLGDDAAARAAFEEAATLLEAQCAETPDDLTFLTNRVVALERLGKTEALRPAVETLLAADPGEIRAYLRLAELHIAAGERDKAIQVLDAIPHPGHEAAVAMYNVAVEMYNDQQYDAAILVLEKALAVEPGSAECHRLLGRIYVAQGDNESAIREMREFLRLAPDDPSAEVERRLIDALQEG
jgi:tetratricopeptide (TPR) repeat protein